MELAALGSHDPLIVLGIDPGTITTGFGVVGRRGRDLVHVDHGAFHAPRSQALEQRLHHMHGSLVRLLEHHRPHVVSLEEAFLRRNVQTALRLGEARAMTLLAAASLDIPVVQYPTAVAKKSVCGHGGADKAAVQAMVQQHLELEAIPDPHDAADGLALALCLLFDPRIDPRFQRALG